jgi:hypothetical protein
MASTPSVGSTVGLTCLLVARLQTTGAYVDGDNFVMAKVVNVYISPGIAGMQNVDIANFNR